MSTFYDFVEFMGPPKAFEKEGNLTGKMVLQIKTLSPVFIGSGYECRDGAALFSTFETYKGTPVIPGSSLKGVLRSISQAVSYSCVDVHKDVIKDLPFSIDENCNCIVCRTYGRMGYRGAVRIGDFLMKEGSMEKIKIPVRRGPNIKAKRIYYKNEKLIGIKFYRHGDYRLINDVKVPVEAVKEGSIFEGEIYFLDMADEQLQLLCYSLGLNKRFQLKLGGNKAGFFGSCEVIPKSGLFSNGSTFKPEEYAHAFDMNCKDIMLNRNKRKLEEILSFQNRVTKL